MPMYLCPQSLLCFTLGCIFYAEFLLLYYLPLHHARETVGALASGFPSLLLQSDFEQEREKSRFFINIFLLPKLLFSPYTEHKERHWTAASYSKKKKSKKVFPSTAALLSLTTSHDTSIPILSQGGLKCKHRWVLEVSPLPHGQRKRTGKMERFVWDQA